LVWFGYYEQKHKHCDYHNYCGEIEAALRKLLSQVSKAFRSGKLWKAFLIYGLWSKKMRLPAGLTAGNYGFMLRGLYFLI